MITHLILKFSFPLNVYFLSYRVLCFHSSWLLELLIPVIIQWINITSLFQFISICRKQLIWNKYVIQLKWPYGKVQKCLCWNVVWCIADVALQNNGALVMPAQSTWPPLSVFSVCCEQTERLLINAGVDGPVSKESPSFVLLTQD